MSDALYRVRIGWGGKNSGVFTVGVSTIAPAAGTAGYDEIGYAFTPTYAGPYDDLSGTAAYMCTDFEIVRGRDNEFSNMTSGTCKISLNDKLPGRYNPKNTASPLYGKIRPMRPIEIAASLDGGANYYLLYNGWLEEGQDNPERGVNEATFSFKDFFLWLSAARNISIPSSGAIYVGAAIGKLLDAVGWINPALRSLQNGTLLPDFSVDPDDAKSPLEIIGELLTVDLGLFYMSRSGVATYIDPATIAAKSSLGTFQAAEVVLPGVALSSIFNEAQVHRLYPDVLNPGQYLEGPAQYYEDTTSGAEFGHRAWDQVKSKYLANDAAALALATAKVNSSLNPVANVWTYTVSEGPTGYLALMLQADLTDRVSVDAYGTTVDYHIQKITHRGKAGELHKTDWVLAERR